jgi:hypothetical protein
MNSKRKAVDVSDGSCGKKKKGARNELGIILTISSERSRYNRLVLRGFIHNRYPDKFALDKLGIRENVYTLLGNIGWSEFVGSIHHTYESQTLEFLSTLCFKKDKDNLTDPNHSVSFSLDNQEFDMSLSQFCDKMGFANAGLIHGSHNEDTRPQDYDQQEFWLKISGHDHFEAKSAKASMIHNPVFRYVHRIMSCTVFGRPETGTVRADELFILWVMVNKRAVNTGYYLLNHLASVAAAKSKGKIVVGGVIRFISKKLGANARAAGDYLEGNYEIDLEFCKNIRMVREVDGSNTNYQLLIYGKDSILLPNPSRTDTTNIENWLYHDVAQQVPQEHNEQNEPQEQQDEPQEQQHEDEEMGDHHEQQQPVGEMENEADWRRRIEAKIDNQGEMLLAMMQHFNIQNPQAGPE